jgi:short-subunit dehydrogenase
MRLYYSIALLISIITSIESTQAANMTANVRKKAIVVGATSGMGREVAKLLATDYDLGLVGRRINLLESLQDKIVTKTIIGQIDITDTINARKKLMELINDLGGLDLMFISVSAWCDVDFTQNFEAYEQLINVDVKGFFTMADIAMEVFTKQRSGHLVGISSIDALRGNASCPAYSGAKAFVGRYLEGIRNQMIQHKIPVYVTDIIPGYVNTERLNFSEKKEAYWVASTKEAAQQIYDAIKAKKKKAYITKRWAIIAWLLDWMPDCIYNAIGGL